jgi:lysozyme
MPVRAMLAVVLGLSLLIVSCASSQAADTQIVPLPGLQLRRSPLADDQPGQAMTQTSAFKFRRAPLAARQPAWAWTANADTIRIIKHFEGLALDAYQLAGQWLIGYGHAADVAPGATITRDRAEALLSSDLGQCEQTVADVVTVPVTRNEFSAMTSLCFNIGSERFAGSVVVQKLNDGDDQGAADAFLYWRKMLEGDQLRIVPYLAKRRATERALFLR